MSTTIFFDRVTITSSDETTSRVMLGGSVGNLNDGLTTTQQGLLLPADGQQDSLPQLTATAYLNGVALDPQPQFQWESSNPGCCAVDQSGNCTRVTNPNAFTYDSNGGAGGGGGLGGLVQISATAKYPNGSVSGVRGTINITVQAAAARQYAPYTASPATGNRSYAGGADNAPASAEGFYGLVEN